MGSDVFRRRMLEATIENRREAAAIKRRIAALYEQAAEDMASKAASSKAGGLTEVFARSLSHSLRERCGELWREVGEATKAGMATRAERMVGVQTAFLADAARRAELDLKPTLQRVFASTSDDAVRHVLQGGIYGGQAPTLSKRIWNNAALQNGQIEQVIAGALAKKQSAVQLAKSLEAYLNPGIVQPDNWNDIYPDMPFVYKVDYNAKRLAVTSINHAGWAATISAARGNPYADYLHWELTPAHVINDVCDGYAAHDEGMGEGNWSLDAAPLPHPFCTCLWYVDTNKTLEEIGRELKAWEEGESNPRLDKAFGEWEERNGSNFDMNFTDKSLDIKVMDGHIDDEVIQSVSDAIATVRSDFPVLDCLKEVLFSEEETGFAAARNDGKALRANTSVFANMHTLKIAFDEAVKTGHTKNAENPMFVIAHELGHILHTQLALKRCGMKEIPLYGGMPAMVYNQSRQQIIIDLFEHSVFTNESASEIYRAIWEEMGTRSRDSNDEMLAQAFGMYYYGQGSHPISDSFVKYMMQEFRR